MHLSAAFLCFVPNWGASVKHPAMAGAPQPFRNDAAAFMGRHCLSVLGNTCFEIFSTNQLSTTLPGVSNCSRMFTQTYYPCLCLCFGFSQITLIEPFLLMILHFSQIGFTDDLTFTGNPPSVNITLICSFRAHLYKVYMRVRILFYHYYISNASTFFGYLPNIYCLPIARTTITAKQRSGKVPGFLGRESTLCNALCQEIIWQLRRS